MDYTHEQGCRMNRPKECGNNTKGFQMSKQKLGMTLLKMKNKSHFQILAGKNIFKVPVSSISEN